MAEVHPLLREYRPGAEDPFDAVKAAHLLNRAGFGGTAEEVEKVLKMGPGAAVEWLMDFPDAPAVGEAGGGPEMSMLEGMPKNQR